MYETVYELLGNTRQGNKISFLSLIQVTYVTPPLPFAVQAGCCTFWDYIVGQTLLCITFVYVAHQSTNTSNN